MVSAVSNARSKQNRSAKPPFLIILARGEKIRHITLKPRQVRWLSALVVLGMLGNLGAASYLILRDDILSTLRAPRLYQYEDKIAELRGRMLELGTQTTLEQSDVHEKVRELLERQQLIAERQDRLEPLFDRKRRPAAQPARQTVPIPRPRPSTRTAQVPAEPKDPPINASAFAPEMRPQIQWPLRMDVPAIPEEPDGKDGLPDSPVNALKHSLLEAEQKQLAQIDTLTRHVYQTAETLEELLESIGIAPATPAGGPLTVTTGLTPFEYQLQELDEALANLDRLRVFAGSIPLINPLPGARVTSRFGKRKDPFHKQVAFHSGVDFRAKRGDLVRAANGSRVIKAGWHGGYGRMVEIDHGSGITTRYAHLQEILVSEGETVPAAAPIGHAGNSGRSTGPHLHYEIRRNGEPLNPMQFIQVGRQLAQLLY